MKAQLCHGDNVDTNAYARHWLWDILQQRVGIVHADMMDWCKANVPQQRICYTSSAVGSLWKRIDRWSSCARVEGRIQEHPWIHTLCSIEIVLPRIGRNAYSSLNLPDTTRPHATVPTPPVAS